MSSHTSISPEKLSRLIGASQAPPPVDVRIDDDVTAIPRLIPAGAAKETHDWPTSKPDRSEKPR